MLLCSPLHGTTIAVVNRAEVYEGHPFVVEAAVAIGGPKAQPVCGDQAAVNDACALSGVVAGHQSVSVCQPYSVIIRGWIRCGHCCGD